MTRNRVRPLWALAAAWLVAGCTTRGADSAGKGADASRAGADTARAAAKADAAGPGYVVRDSADVFDPDGYYAPMDTIRLGGYLLQPLELHTVDYYYEGKVHHDRPRVLVPPRADFGLSAPAQEGITSNPCRDVRITPDTLSLRCPGTRVGDIAVEGRFLVRAQLFFDAPFNDDAAPVLSARVVVTRDGREVHNAVHAFRYTSGE